MTKMVLIGLVTDSKCRPVQTYLRECQMFFLVRSVRRVGDNNKRLQFILVDGRCKDDALANKAHKRVLCHYHGEGENIENKYAAEPPAQVM